MSVQQVPGSVAPTFQYTNMVIKYRTNFYSINPSKINVYQESFFRTEINFIMQYPIRKQE